MKDTARIDGPRWYLAQMKPQSHQIALRNLQRQGFEVFLPMQNVTGKARGRFVTRLQPFFPGYLFVAFDVSTGAQRKVNSTLGLTRVVSIAGRPVAVPDSLVAALRARCDDRGCIVARDEVRAGDKVRLLTGPFANFVTTIERVDPQRRVWVLIDLLGRKARVAVEGGDWQAV